MLNWVMELNYGVESRQVVDVNVKVELDFWFIQVDCDLELTLKL